METPVFSTSTKISSTCDNIYKSGVTICLTLGKTLAHNKVMNRIDEE